MPDYMMGYASAEVLAASEDKVKEVNDAQVDDPDDEFDDDPDDEFDDDPDDEFDGDGDSEDELDNEPDDEFSDDELDDDFDEDDSDDDDFNEDDLDDETDDDFEGGFDDEDLEDDHSDDDDSDADDPSDELDDDDDDDLDDPDEFDEDLNENDSDDDDSDDDDPDEFNDDDDEYVFLYGTITAIEEDEDVLYLEDIEVSTADLDDLDVRVLVEGMFVEVYGPVQEDDIVALTVEIFEPEMWSYFEGPASLIYPDESTSLLQIWQFDAEGFDDWREESSDEATREVIVINFYDGSDFEFNYDFLPQISSSREALYLLEGSVSNGRVTWHTIEVID
ncbi:MAG: hypothetical protein AAF267_00435 [Deinococcota bacterium]